MLERSVATTRLRTSHAFHSPMMDGVIEPFFAILREIRLAPPKIPIISSVTGRELSPEQATDPRYWAEHVRRTVRFADALVGGLAPLARLRRARGRTACDAGHARPADQRRSAQPGLPALARRRRQAAGRRRPRRAGRVLARRGGLWAQGVVLDFRAFFEGDARRRVPVADLSVRAQALLIDPPQRQPRRAQRASAAARSADKRGTHAPPDRRAAILDAVRQVLEEASGMNLPAGATRGQLCRARPGLAGAHPVRAADFSSA